MSDQPRLDGQSPATGRDVSSDSAAAVTGGPRNFFYIWVSALAVVMGVLLHESLFGGKGLVPADGVFSFLPWRETKPPSNYLLLDQYTVFVPQHEFMHQQFLQRHFPLWNPCLDCGVPNLGSIQGALLFPINLLLQPLDPFHASGVAAFLKLFLAGWFTMLYLRRLGASNSGAFLSGLVFSLSGFMIVWLGHPHVNCAMWLPLLLYLIEKSFPDARGAAPGLAGASALRVWVGFAVAFACLLLGGHPPTTIHVTLFVSIYFLFRLIGQRKDQPFLRMGLCLCAMVLGFLLAAPQLLPFLEYYRYSALDVSSHISHRTAIRLLPNTLIFYLFPHLSGSPAEGFGETMLRLGIGKLLPNFNERTGYVGILPLLFALYAVIGRRCRLTMFYASSALVSLLVIYGVPPLPAMLGALPVLRDIYPTRLLMVVGFSLAVLAGLGWDRFHRSEDRRLRFWVVTGFWTAIGLVLLWCWQWVGPRWNHLDEAHRAFLRPQFLMLAGSLVVSVALLLRFINRQRWLCLAIGLGWVTVDLLVFGMGYNPAIPRDCYYPSTPAIEWLKQDTTNFRVWGEKQVLVPNTAEIFGLRDARGCDFMTVQRYEELINGQAGDFFFYSLAPSLPKPFQLLNVKYVLIFRSPAPDPGLFELVYSNEITIYRYRAFRERAMVVFDCRVDHSPASILGSVRSGTFDPERVLLLEAEPENGKALSEIQTLATRTNSSVRIVSDQPDEVSIEAFLPQPGFLLLLDTWFPGWSATVNGQPARIYRADYNFRAVELPAGKSTVQFVYRPGSFRWGVVFFLTGLLVLAAAWFWPRKARSSEASASTRESMTG
jgi:hypothetical protein